MNTTNSNNVYHIYYDHEANCIVMNWTGYATSQQFRVGTELMLDSLVSYECTKVLADTKDMFLIGREDQKWLETNFVPRAIKCGMKTLAIVNSVHYFNRVAIETISGKIDSKRLKIQLFKETSEALEWLRDQG